MKVSLSNRHTYYVRSRVALTSQVKRTRSEAWEDADEVLEESDLKTNQLDGPYLELG